MKIKNSSKHKKKFKKLIHNAKCIGKDALIEAAATDDVLSFPAKTLENIKKTKLLTACISKKYGGENLGLKAGTNVALLTVLKHVGSGNLVMGRVLEGHINAQLLIDQFGTKKQKKRFAKDAFRGRLFGVWNTQADDGTKISWKKNGTYTLNGAKTFATGTGYVTRPIITAALPDGAWQMLVLPLDEVQMKVEKNWWNPMGMKASRSYKMNFANTTVRRKDLLGKSGAYYHQPAFSGGAIRFAAVQLGAAEKILDETRMYLRNLGRTEDPFQKMRLGKMAIAVQSGNMWLTNAAKQLDLFMLHPVHENSERFLAFTNMMRTAIEAICTEVMALCQKCVGARGLNKPFHFERIIRDLNTYLRQPAPDAALADAGAYVLQTDIPSSELWERAFDHKI